MTALGPTARVVDGVTGETLAGDDLRAAVDGVRQGLEAAPPGVLFLRAPTAVATVLRLAAALESGRPVALVDPGLPDDLLTALLGRYHPALVLGGSPDDAVPDGWTTREDDALGTVWTPTVGPRVTPHPDLAVLLATSGSTGDPKLVRLSRRGIAANATAIGLALGITTEDVALTTLPLHYSYGMSVVTSHLAAGATLVVADTSLVSRDFWTLVDAHGVTSVALVPSQYAMLHRLRFDPAAHPSLRTLTQAGGHLDSALVTEFASLMAGVDGRLFVMYGATEAGPRMTTLPADRVLEKAGSVGPAVPGGSLAIRDADGVEHTEPGVDGEVVYRGPNVMMGYAHGEDDLSRGDDLGGVLVTGDLGRLDDEGFLTLTGRAARFAKVFGVRVSLDDVERLFAEAAPVAAVSGDDTVVVFAEREPEGGLTALAQRVATGLRLHWTGFETRLVDALPLLPSGKTDYAALERRR